MVSWMDWLPEWVLSTALMAVLAAALAPSATSWKTCSNPISSLGGFIDRFGLIEGALHNLGNNHTDLFHGAGSLADG